MNKDRIIDELNLQFYGGKGWRRSEECKCVECEKSDKFGVLFTENSGIVKCMRCDYTTSLFNYLIKIGRSELVEGFSAPLQDEIKFLHGEPSIIGNQVNNVELPKGFKRCYYDDYLEDRGFTEFQYNHLKVGTSKDIRLRKHLIFPIYKDGKLETWLARSRKSKDWHKQNIKDFKAGLTRLIIRYYNADGTNLEEVLGGYDEIIEGETIKVILVEGLFDKINVDNLLKLYDSNRIKCCFTFGKNLSEQQVKLIKQKGIGDLTLMYDPDAIDKIQEFGLIYMKGFDSIECVKLIGEKDPGDMNVEELKVIMAQSTNPLEFYLNNLKKL